MVRKHIASIGRIDIVEAISSDAEHLQNTLRPTDIRECQIHGVTPFKALHLPFKENRHHTLTAMVNDIPICMFGTVPIRQDVGSVWLLGNDLLEKNHVSFLKASKEMIELVQTHYPIIENVVPADHHKTIEWLMWLGFVFHTEPVIINSYACLRFVRCQVNVEVQLRPA